MKSYIMAVRKYHKVIKMNFDPNAPKGSKEEVPGKPGIKNPDTGEVVTLQWMT